MSQSTGIRARAAACRALLTGAAVLLAAFFAAPPAADAEQLADDFYGVNIGGVISLPREQWDVHLGAIAGSGITLVRYDASWIGAEPDPPDPATGEHTYRWEGFDDQVAALSRHGLRWYPILDYSTAWSGVTPNDSKSRPARFEDYAAYARAFADRYGANGNFWKEHPELPRLPVQAYEIWNEPNSGLFWREQQTAPEDYIDLYLTSRAAIRQVDPSARVVVGGLLDGGYPNRTEYFIRRMYSHRPDARGNVDALGYHPYRGVDGIVESLTIIRRVLNSIGEERVPIEVTEVGYSAETTPEPSRARSLTQIAQELPRLDLNLSRLMPHTWTEDGGYAIYNTDATPKPSGTAYVTAVQSMSGQALPDDRPRLSLRFRRGRTRQGWPCARGAVRVKSTGVFPGKVTRVEFLVEGRRVGVDRRAPFGVRIPPHRLVRRHRVGVRIVDLSGRELRRSRPIRPCGRIGAKKRSRRAPRR